MSARAPEGTPGGSPAQNLVACNGHGGPRGPNVVLSNRCQFRTFPHCREPRVEYPTHKVKWVAVP